MWKLFRNNLSAVKKYYGRIHYYNILPHPKGNYNSGFASSVNIVKREIPTEGTVGRQIFSYRL